MSSNQVAAPSRKQSFLSHSESSQSCENPQRPAPPSGKISRKNTNELFSKVETLVLEGLRPPTPPLNDSAGSLSDTEIEYVRTRRKLSTKIKPQKNKKNGELDKKTFHVISKIILPDIIFMEDGAKMTYESFIRSNMLKNLEDIYKKKSDKFLSIFKRINGQAKNKERLKFQKKSIDLDWIKKTCLELTIGSFESFSKPSLDQIFACIDPGFTSSIIDEIKKTIQENILHDSFESLDDFKTRTAIIKIFPIHKKNFEEIDRLNLRSKVIELQLFELKDAIKLKSEKIKADLIEKHKFNHQSELIACLKKYYLSNIGYDDLDSNEPIHMYVSKGYKLLKKEEVKKILLDVYKKIGEERNIAKSQEVKSLDEFISMLYSKDKTSAKRYFSNSHEHNLNIKVCVYKLKLAVLEDFINHQKEQIALLTGRLSVIQQYLQKSTKPTETKNTFLNSLGEHLQFAYITNFLDKHFIAIGRDLLKILSIQFNRSFLYKDVKSEVKNALFKLEAKRDVIKEFQSYLAEGRLMIMDESSILVPPVTINDSHYKNLNLKDWLDGPNRTIRTVGRLLCDGNDLFYRDLTNLIHVIADLVKQGAFSLSKKLKPEQIDPIIQMMINKMHEIEANDTLYEKMTDKKAKDEIAKKALEKHANNYTFLSKMLEQTHNLPIEFETLIHEILVSKNINHEKIILDIGLSRIIGTLLILYGSPSQKHFLKALRSLTDGCKQVFDRQKAYISHSTSDVSSEDDMLNSMIALNSSGTESTAEKEPESSEELLFGKDELIIIRAFNKDFLKIEFIKDTMIDGFAEIGFLEQITVEIDLKAVSCSTMTVPPESIHETAHFHFKAPPGDEWKKNPLVQQHLRKLQLYLAMAGYPPMTIVEVSKEGMLAN